MIIVGLTGGIGSGKTTVANFFKALGVPIYTSDIQAKNIINTSKIINKKLTALFGEKAYKNGILNKTYIADIIFTDNTYLKKMNAIVHPKVTAHFKKWVNKQQAPYVIKEAAILFESGSYKDCDIIITVTAPKATKIERLLKRDSTSVDKISAIMKNQWDDAQKIKLSQFVITNKTLESTQKQVLKIHQNIFNSNL